MAAANLANATSRALVRRLFSSAAEYFYHTRSALPKLAKTVQNFPILSGGPKSEALAATGTDPRPDRALTRTGPVIAPLLTDHDGTRPEGHGKEQSPNRLEKMGVAEGCGNVMADEESSPSRTRTYNKPVNSRLLYH